MEPVYRPGQLLFVDPRKAYKRGDDVILRIRDGDEEYGVVKRFISASTEKVVVEQFQPKKKLEFKTSDVISIDVVVASMASG